MSETLEAACGLKIIKLQSKEAWALFFEWWNGSRNNYDNLSNSESLTIEKILLNQHKSEGLWDVNY